MKPSSTMPPDLLRKGLRPNISESKELLAARIAAGVAGCIAGYFGINPPGFVAQVVAFAFGLAQQLVEEIRIPRSATPAPRSR